MQPQTALSAFVLHSRPYKESSALVDLFTPQGRLRAVLRAARGRTGAKVRAFVPLEIELRGKGELKNLGRAEATGLGHFLQGDALFSALYLNELIMRLLPLESPYEALYAHYSLTLEALAQGQRLEPLLRAFEWRLLQELGYGFSLQFDRHGQAIEPDNWYRLSAEGGFECVGQLASGLFYGADIAAMAEANWQVPGALAAAKRLMRQALAGVLGARPLVSRELFINVKESVNGKG